MCTQYTRFFISYTMFARPHTATERTALALHVFVLLSGRGGHTQKMDFGFTGT
jgi:hypothetical protein